MKPATWPKLEKQQDHQQRRHEWCPRCGLAARAAWQSKQAQLTTRQHTLVQHAPLSAHLPALLLHRLLGGGDGLVGRRLRNRDVVEDAGGTKGRGTQGSGGWMQGRAVGEIPSPRLPLVAQQTSQSPSAPACAVQAKGDTGCQRREGAGSIILPPTLGHCRTLSTSPYLDWVSAEGAPCGPPCAPCTKAFTSGGPAPARPCGRRFVGDCERL